MSIVINGTKGNGANVHSLVHPNITLPAGTYTVKVKMISGSITDLTADDGLFFGINQSTYGQRTTPGVKQVGDVGKRTFTLTNDTLLSSIDIAPSYGSQGSEWTNATFECWFYAGSDDKPYEPYGYKIPISSASTTTPVYLGEVESTRRIKKLVLTGEEEWSKVSLSDGSAFYTNIASPAISVQSIDIRCTHYRASTTNENYVVRIPNVANRLLIIHKEISTITEFKTYLAAQYAAGTPVTVWYVLATPETGIVNEPLMKIGDYADELSGISIPVTAGGDTISVDTTVQPSEVTVNYKGWHPAIVHERTNGAWT